MQTQSNEELAVMTPDEALALLEAGNQRFVAGKQKTTSCCSRWQRPAEASNPLQWC